MYRREVKAEKYLYHYTSPDSFFKILNSKSLRFNFFSKMNDPKESKYWSANLSNEDLDKYIKEERGNTKKLNSEIFYRYNDMKEKLFNQLKNKIQVICFTIDIDLSNKGIIGNNAYLYRGFGNPYFWAHYGNSQKGVCIQIFRERIEEKLKSLVVDNLFKERIVRYDDNVFEGNPAFITFNDLKNKKNEEIVKECIFKNHRYYLFTKTKFWQAEHEYRIVIYSEVEEYMYLDITDCISSIIVGEDIGDNDEKKILDTGMERKISVAKINWGNGYPTAVTISKYEANYDYD